MNFIQAFDSIKSSIKNFDSSKFDGNFAIQLTLKNKDCGGIFYIEYKDGILNIEPYNYYDNNVTITAGYSDLCKALGGKLSLDSKKLEFTGDSELFAAFVSAIKFEMAEPVKKAQAKKTATKTTATKKAPAKKATTK